MDGYSPKYDHNKIYVLTQSHCLFRNNLDGPTKHTQKNCQCCTKWNDNLSWVNITCGLDSFNRSQ